MLDEGDLKRECFLRDNHHLISPFLYTPAQLKNRELWFFRLMWRRSEGQDDVAAYLA